MLLGDVMVWKGGLKSQLYHRCGSPAISASQFCIPSMSRYRPAETHDKLSKHCGSSDLCLESFGLWSSATLRAVPLTALCYL